MVRKGKKDSEDDRYIGRTNIPDYNVPTGVQLTENLNEELAEAVHRKTPEASPEQG